MDLQPSFGGAGDQGRPQETNLAGWGASFVPMFEGQVTHGG